jgi:GH24 family phage-related lysozyme (muramidase)
MRTLVILILFSIGMKHNSGGFGSAQPPLNRSLSGVEGKGDGKALHSTLYADDSTLYAMSIELIKKWEKFSPTRYVLFGDTYIGYGHLLTKNDTISLISELIADSILRSDLARAQKQVNRLCPKLAKNKRLFLANFVFNVGIGTLKKSKLLAMIKSHAPDSLVQKEYFGYVYAKKRYLPKMVNRRADEWKIFKPQTLVETFE